MADLNKLLTPLFLNEKEIRKIIELMFFSYRDFTSGPDKILEKIKFGRAHHRVIYFVGKSDNLTIKELLSILQITKQSLSRVLNQYLFTTVIIHLYIFISISLWGISTVGIMTPIMYNIIPYFITYSIFIFLKQLINIR